MIQLCTHTTRDQGYVSTDRQLKGQELEARHVARELIQEADALAKR